MKLYAISDLHLDYSVNRQALLELPPHSQDWLILAGDVGESIELLRLALRELTEKFAKVIWVPGNHDLWTSSKDPLAPRGVAKYEQMVDLCREFGALTPEDAYIEWPGPGPKYLLAPIFTLYDYSFRPPHVTFEEALPWAAEEGIVCADENLLYPYPFASRQDWCTSRCAFTEDRLRRVDSPYPLILIGHFPLRQGLAVLPRVPRFCIWCGTTLTQDWHQRFNAAIVISGHLHIRSRRWVDSVRFEEVSFGYPKQRRVELGLEPYLREILPGPTPVPGTTAPTFFGPNPGH